MNALYGATSMCLACEPRLPGLPAAEPPSKAPGPQYFTFDPLPALERPPARRGKKRLRRVLYPPVVKRYYPAQERSPAKRLLVFLLLVIVYQVYSADEDPALAPELGCPDCSMASGLPGCPPPPPPVPLQVPETANATSPADPAAELAQLLEQNPAAF
ncbi:radiation-inducible immediate-early gene IEX-1 [Carettochelys insculpta]|uniref:radiation-inducible immediate-early gene IEX-1 n=1 Tax=Carettochelys insculpta TaxID=44489 RepID=UPI003EB84678